MWAKHKRTLKYVNVTAVLPNLVVKKRWNEKICTSMNRHNLLPSVFLTQTHTIPQTHTYKQEEDTSNRTFWTRLFHHYLNNLQMQLSYRLIMPFSLLRQNNDNKWTENMMPDPLSGLLIMNTGGQWMNSEDMTGLVLGTH